MKLMELLNIAQVYKKYACISVIVLQISQPSLKTVQIWSVGY